MPKRLTIEDCHAEAIYCARTGTYRGGKFRSPEYLGATIPHEWECKEGHRNWQTPASVRDGKWCRDCTRYMKKTYEDCQREAHICAKNGKYRGGQFLDTEYRGSDKTHTWCCAVGHTWTASPAQVFAGTWCPECSPTRRLTIEDMDRVALERGGWCITVAYKNNRTKVRWRCKTGHEWSAKPNSIIQSKSWCAICEGLNPGSIEECQEIAKSRGGECLSEAYTNARTKLLWRCGNNHTWLAKPGQVKFSTWCPHCQSKQREREARAIFEGIFGEPFPNSPRLPFLPSPVESKRRQYFLELDGFNATLKLAWEYMGEQHYHAEAFNQGKRALALIQRRDAAKVDGCERAGIDLIRIPYSIVDLKSHILESWSKICTRNARP